MKLVGIGIDVEPAESFRKKSLVKHRRLYERIFSPREIAYCKKFHDSAPHFAARFCAKEALIKAARSVLRAYITDFEIHNEVSGAPRLRRRSKRTHVMKFFSLHDVFVSLSHTNDLAAAFVVVSQKP